MTSRYVIGFNYIMADPIFEIIKIIKVALHQRIAPARICILILSIPVNNSDGAR